MSVEKSVRSNPYFTPTRVMSLYSDFRCLKTLNPEGYEANLNAWKSLLAQLLEEHSLEDFLSVDAIKLEEKLVLPECGKPLGLGEVFSVLSERDFLIPYSIYKSRTESIYKTSWFSLTGTLSWCIHKTGLSSLSFRSDYNLLRPENYIILSHLESYGKRILSIIHEKDQGYSSRVFTKAYLFTLINESVSKISVLDFDILLIYLSRDANTCSIDRDTIKFKEKVLNEGEHFSKSESIIVTEDDHSVAHLKATIELISNRNKDLAQKINDSDEKIKESLSKNRKEQARVYLKTRKVFDNSLEKSSNSLSNLLMILVKIDDATTHISTFETLQKSSEVLKKLNSSIDFERLDDLMIELEENISNVDKVSDDLTFFKNDIDEEEIDDELNELYEQETKKKIKQNRIDEDRIKDAEEEHDKEEEDELLSRLTKLKFRNSPNSEVEKEESKQMETV